MSVTVGDVRRFVSRDVRDDSTNKSKICMMSVIDLKKCKIPIKIYLV